MASNPNWWKSSPLVSPAGTGEGRSWATPSTSGTATRNDAIKVRWRSFTHEQPIRRRGHPQAHHNLLELALLETTWPVRCFCGRYAVGAEPDSTRAIDLLDGCAGKHFYRSGFRIALRLERC